MKSKDHRAKVNPIVIPPSEYPCCAQGTCPQHQQQGESDIATSVNTYNPKHTQASNRPPWSEASSSS
jgi:hypothetical protein